MSVGFQRRFSSDPGTDVLTAIEGVAIIDRAPPQIATGTGTGTVCVAAEFENGPFASDVGPVEIFGADDLLNKFGDFGYSYAGEGSANNPCARIRNADAALLDEFWNGNGAVALARKGFRRLVLARVDTSVGAVEFTRLASLSGRAAFTYDLEPAQTLVFDVGAGNVTATFTAVAATTNSGAGVYPSTFAGGEWIEFKIDGGSTIRATFLAADQTQAQVIARMNAAAGYTAFAINVAPVTSIKGRIRGTSGSVQITAVSAVLVTTATGFVAGAAVIGTGNVGNIDQVTVAEVDTIVNAVDPDTNVDIDANGKIRIFATLGEITIDSTTTATAFGFATETINEASSGSNGLIPAGTRIETAGGIEFVTMQDLAVTSANVGPYRVKIRHSLDDGTGVSRLVATINTITAPIALGAFSVTNPLPTTACLTEAQLDAAYVVAIGKTKATSNVGKQINIIVSARQSNMVRNELRQNCIDASANGCEGRICVIRPPLGSTTRAMARSNVVQPGVGPTRSDQVVYAFPGGQLTMTAIASKGLLGGDGFTADGVIDVGSDVWGASVMSRLNPEENPGQQTEFMAGFLAIEANNPDVQDLTMEDYIAFKAVGILAPRVDNGTAFFQSGVNSVDPVEKALRNISRRRMAFYIEDSIATTTLPFTKKLAITDRKSLVISVIDAFLAGLLSTDNPENQRIDSYAPIQNISTANDTKQGILRLRIKVKLIGSLDVIVVDSSIGETVETTEIAA